MVTVLFADVVGFTGWSEHLDPERVKRLIDATIQRLVTDVVEFGGKVDKVLGDGVLALFGAPVAHENDPERAIRAALQMHDSLATMMGELGDGAEPIQLRVGVNTGEVLVGTTPGTGDYTAMGDVVNVASRLQALAPPGGIFVGDTTAALADARIAFELVDDLDVRGRDQTERVWRVVGRRPGVAPSGGRRDRPFIGRATQRALLASLVGMVRNGRSAVVAVTGEAGAGKTRLVDEALAGPPGDELQVFAGACAPFGERNVWAPIAEALFQPIVFDPSASNPRLREVCRERAVSLHRFAPDDPALDWFVEGTMHLLGEPSELDTVPPNEAREALFGLVVESVRRRSMDAPVVVWIDDLQWADPLLVDLLHRLTRSIVDRPVLVVTAQRDDTDLDWPPATDLPITVRLPLDPLDHAEAHALVASVVGPDLAHDLAGTLFERSGGNPLFLTELAELTAEQPESTDLPGSLRALIAARLDSLGPGPRAVLDNAAVLGVSGSVHALEHFAAAMRQEMTALDLDTLIDAGLLEARRGWWRFRSDVVREVAYQTLTKTARAQRHAGTAAVMAGEEGAPIDEIAHHAAAAAELVREMGEVPGVPHDIADRASRLLARAVRRALDVGAFSQARRNATRALELRPSDPAVERELLLLRAETAVERREPDVALPDVAAALESSVAGGDLRDEAIARRLDGAAAHMRGDLPLARRQLGASVDLLRELGDDAQLATSLSDRGFAEVFGGSLADAEVYLAEAEGIFERLEDRRRTAWVRQHQAWVAFLSGDTALATERLTVALRVFEELGDQSGTGWALGLLAWVRFMDRRLDEAAELATRVRTLSLELGERWAPAMMDSLLAAICVWSGQFAEAERLSRRALGVLRALGDRFGIVQALAPRMRALVALGRTQEAERGLEEAVALSAAFGDLAFPMMAAAGTAVHLGLGDRAVQLGEDAVARVQRMRADGSEARVTLALGWCQVGRPEDALGTLMEVTSDTPYSMAARAVASAMAGDGRAAMSDADGVHAAAGSTYLDRVLADLAAAAALLADGDRDGVVARLDRARATAEEAGDSVARSLVGAASTAFIGGDGVPTLGDPGDGPLGDGWQRVVTGLLAAAARPGRDGPVAAAAP